MLAAVLLLLRVAADSDDLIIPGLDYPATETPSKDDMAGVLTAVGSLFGFLTFTLMRNRGLDVTALITPLTRRIKNCYNYATRYLHGAPKRRTPKPYRDRLVLGLRKPPIMPTHIKEASTDEMSASFHMPTVSVSRSATSSGALTERYSVIQTPISQVLFKTTPRKVRLVGRKVPPVRVVSLDTAITMSTSPSSLPSPLTPSSLSLAFSLPSSAASVLPEPPPNNQARLLARILQHSTPEGLSWECPYSGPAYGFAGWESDLQYYRAFRGPHFL